jgi:inner membrane protein
MEGFSFEFWTVWSWLTIGLALVIIEMVAPGLIFVWFGVAAIILGLIVAALPDMSWETQLVLFAVLSVISLGSGRMWLKKNPVQTEDNGLNRRAEQYVGRVFTLAEPVADGEGKLKVDDTFWKISGADLPQGARVRVTGTHGTILTVEPE